MKEESCVHTTGTDEEEEVWSRITVSDRTPVQVTKHE